MNIRDFLIDNYIYIIIIIVLSIVTIIGFLADKKKTADKRPNTMGGNIGTPTPDGNNMQYQPQQNTNEPITYQQNNNPVGNNMQYNPVQPENNVASPINNMATPMNNNMIPTPEPTPNIVNEMNYNAPQPVEPINAVPNTGPESLYQPLSEQKPSFAPVEPNVNMANNQMATNVVEPMINPVPIQPAPNVVQPNPMDQMNMTGAPIANPMPNPVPAQPMPNQGGNTIPNPITPPQPVSPQPVNFTYGNGNNNGFMQ